MLSMAVGKKSRLLQNALETQMHRFEFTQFYGPQFQERISNG